MKPVFLLLQRVACAAFVGAACLAIGQSAVAAPGAGPKLNFVFMLVDDLGWTDVGCFGSTFYETPHIDRLARQGMRFTDAYAACCVCSPTRASILAGKYPARLHLTDWIAGHKRPYAKLAVPDWTMYLPHEEVTLAEALKPGGYAAASVGKWHLGGEEYRPETQGFDLNFGGDHRGSPPSYFWPYQIPVIATGQSGEYLTDRLTDEALKFIETNKDKPFLLYLPHYAVHKPLQAKKELAQRYEAKIKPGQAQNNSTYAAMIESVDQSVGRLMQKLVELGIDQRTVIFFMSDNGGLIPVTSNAPLRAGKGSPWEGGVREPMIVRWPGVVQPGSVCRVPVISVDFYPTILEMAGLPGDPKHNAQVDGVSLVPLLKQTGTIKRDAIYWHYPHYHPGGATPNGSIRAGDFKLIEFYEDNRIELYNLREDLGEQHNLAEKLPQKADQLRQMLHQWRTSVNAQMPTPNPNYDPAKDQQKEPKSDKKEAKPGKKGKPQAKQVSWAEDAPWGE